MPTPGMTDATTNQSSLDIDALIRHGRLFGGVVRLQWEPVSADGFVESA